MIKNPNRYINHIHKKVGQIIQSHQMIEANDRILVGLSGGKDSLILCETLALRKKYFPFPFEVIAAHIYINNIGYQVDHDFLKKYCEALNIPLHIEEFRVEIENDKSPCFVCSWHRRKTLFNLTKTLNCNKVALGHHMDDAVETMIMNMIYHGSISSLPYKVTFFEGRVEVIRPLLECTDKQLHEFAKYRNFPNEIKTCPESEKSGRKEIKDLLNQMGHLNKDARINLFRCVNKQFPEYLPLNNEKKT